MRDPLLGGDPRQNLDGGTLPQRRRRTVKRPESGIEPGRNEAPTRGLPPPRSLIHIAVRHRRRGRRLLLRDIRDERLGRQQQRRD